MSHVLLLKSRGDSTTFFLLVELKEKPSVSFVSTFLCRSRWSVFFDNRLRFIQAFFNVKARLRFSGLSSKDVIDVLFEGVLLHTQLFKRS